MNEPLDSDEEESFYGKDVYGNSIIIEGLEDDTLISDTVASVDPKLLDYYTVPTLRYIGMHAIKSYIKDVGNFNIEHPNASIVVNAVMTNAYVLLSGIRRTVDISIALDDVLDLVGAMQYKFGDMIDTLIKGEKRVFVYYLHPFSLNDESKDNLLTHKEYKSIRVSEANDHEDPQKRLLCIGFNPKYAQEMGYIDTENPDLGLAEA